jgi:hypothetical protein
MIKNLHFLLILGQKSPKKIWKQHVSTKLDKGFRLVYKLSCLVQEKFWSIFPHMGDPYQKKSESLIKNEKIDFFARECKYPENSKTSFFTRFLGSENV